MRPILAQIFCMEAFFKAMMQEGRAWAENSSHSAEDVVIKVWGWWSSWYFHGRVLQMKELCGGTELPFKTWSQVGVCMRRLGLRGLAKSRCYIRMTIEPRTKSWGTWEIWLPPEWRDLDVLRGRLGPQKAIPLV